MLRELRNIILLRDWRKPTGRADRFVLILGGVIALIGIMLALGGAKLIAVGGSWYYLFAGLAVIVAGLAVAQRKPLGGWIYAGVFVATMIWALGSQPKRLAAGAAFSWAARLLTTRHFILACTGRGTWTSAKAMDTRRLCV